MRASGTWARRRTRRGPRRSCRRSSSQGAVEQGRVARGLPRRRPGRCRSGDGLGLPAVSTSRAAVLARARAMPRDQLDAAPAARTGSPSGCRWPRRRGAGPGVMTMVSGQPPLPVIIWQTRHVDPVDVRPLLAVHLDADEGLVRGGRPTSSSSKDSCAMTWHQWQVE